MSRFPSNGSLDDLLDTYLGIRLLTSSLNGLFSSFANYINMWSKYKPTDGTLYGITPTSINDVTSIPSNFNRAWTYDAIVQNQKRLAKFVDYDDDVIPVSTFNTYGSPYNSSPSGEDTTFDCELSQLGSSTNYRISFADVLGSGYYFWVRCVPRGSGTSHTVKCSSSLANGGDSITVDVTGWDAGTYDVYPFIANSSCTDLYSMPIVYSGTVTVQEAVQPEVHPCTLLLLKNHNDGSTISSPVSLHAGNSLEIDAYVEPSNCTDAVVWSLSSYTYFTLSGSAEKQRTLIVDSSAPDNSQTILTASCGNEHVNITVNVASSVVHVSSITLPSDTSVSILNSTSITATINPSNADNKKVKWNSSSKTKVRLYTDSACTSEVDYTSFINNLTVYAKGLDDGSSTISVTTQDGSKSDSMTVTVTSVSVTSVTLLNSIGTHQSLNIRKGYYYQFSYSVSPSNADIESVQFTSSNTSIATVSSSGKVHCEGSGGSSVIKVKVTDYKGHSEEDSITVYGLLPTISIDQTDPITMGTSSTVGLSVTTFPSNAASNVVWSVSNSAGSFNPSTGGSVNFTSGSTPISSATITAKFQAPDGDWYQDTCGLNITSTKGIDLTGILQNDKITWEVTVYGGTSRPTSNGTLTLSYTSGGNQTIVGTRSVGFSSATEVTVHGVTGWRMQSTPSTSFDAVSGVSLYKLGFVLTGYGSKEVDVISSQ